MAIDLDELLSIYRDCVKQCIDTLDKLTFSNQYRENLHICKKDCVAHCLKQYFYSYPFVYRSKIPCFTRCFFLFLRHGNRDLLYSCIMNCVWFK